MMDGASSFISAIGDHVMRAILDLGLDEFVSPEVIERDLAVFQVRLGQIISDVELARLRGVPFHVAVHAHEVYPHLSRAHGLLRDALLREVPTELLPLARAIVSRPPPDWAPDFRSDLCIVARSCEAKPEERALCRLLLFEGLWFNLFMAARQTNGRFEGAGAGGRDIERAASESFEKLLTVPLIPASHSRTP
jgi:hypothetical protein